SHRALSVSACCSRPCSLPFFFLMLPPPPRSTLFPYTTLFRSWMVEIILFFPKSLLIYVFRNLVLLVYYLLPLIQKSINLCLVCLDRKSTRLNSSHVSISYAVFCLKKKKLIFNNHTHVTSSST